MAGCRPFEPDEVSRIRSALLVGPNGLRNSALHVLGCNSGYRVAELLSLQRCDVIRPDGSVADSILVRGKGRRLRAMPIHPTARPDLVRWLIEQQRTGHAEPEQHLFPVSAKQARAILRDACRTAAVHGGDRTIGTHSWRKTFAQGVYRQCLRRLATGDLVDPIFETMRALGHSDPATTVRYLIDIRSASSVLSTSIEVMS